MLFVCYFVHIGSLATSRKLAVVQRMHHTSSRLFWEVLSTRSKASTISTPESPFLRLLCVFSSWSQFAPDVICWLALHFFAFTQNTITLGQKVAVLAFDCCGVVHSSVIGMYLPSLLVSLGIVETCIILYFQYVPLYSFYVTFPSHLLRRLFFKASHSNFTFFKFAFPPRLCNFKK